MGKGKRLLRNWGGQTGIEREEEIEKHSRQYLVCFVLQATDNHICILFTLSCSVDQRRHLGWAVAIRSHRRRPYCQVVPFPELCFFTVWPCGKEVFFWSFVVGNKCEHMNRKGCWKRWNMIVKALFMEALSRRPFFPFLHFKNSNKLCSTHSCKG